MLMPRRSSIKPGTQQARSPHVLLRALASRKKLLPGAALKPATAWGVENILQKPQKFLRSTYDGHVTWMYEYNWVDTVVTLVLVLAASIAGAIIKTGLFHFVVALSILPRIDYEAMAPNLSPLFYTYATTAPS